MKILILSMIITCCGSPLAGHKMAQLKRSKGFSMIIRSEQGKRLADHLIELEIITYLNHKTVQLANGVGVRGQEIADYLGISNKTVAQHLQNSELDLHRVRRTESGETVWVYNGTEALPAGALQIDGIADIPYNHQPIIKFFTSANITQKLQDGVAVSTAEVAQAIGEVPNKQFNKRIKFLRAYLGIVPVHGFQPREGIWQKKAVDKGVANINRKPTIAELLREFFVRPEIITKLENGEGITSRFIAQSLGVDLPRIANQIGRLKEEFNLERVITHPEEDNIWTRRGAYSAEPTAVPKHRAAVRKILADFFNRPDIAQRLANGTGLTSREIGESLNLNKSAYAITKYLEDLKDSLSIKPIKKIGGWLWIHKDASYVATEQPPSLSKTFPSGWTLREFFAQPAVVARMSDGRGITTAEIAEALGHLQGAGSLGQILRHSGKYLGIKVYTRRGDQKRLWMRDSTEPTPNYKKALKQATPAADK